MLLEEKRGPILDLCFLFIFLAFMDKTSPALKIGQTSKRNIGTVDKFCAEFVGTICRREILRMKRTIASSVLVDSIPSNRPVKDYSIVAISGGSEYIPREGRELVILFVIFSGMASRRFVVQKRIENKIIRIGKTQHLDLILIMGL
jgi:hypothetical protein